MMRKELWEEAGTECMQWKRGQLRRKVLSGRPLNKFVFQMAPQLGAVETVLRSTYLRPLNTDVIGKLARPLGREGNEAAEEVILSR
ncbi:hypothetical protein RRG08_038047 [Elysia crispata]|uniref:Uncharacterized protein n=1 Tax=Elysia crispata TaxID=231223 RepID=A0AAE1DPE2_9GAST|nr:hypothetical protein RRG08_038047 [Elysia crispata]